MDVQPSSGDQLRHVRDNRPIVVGVSAGDGAASAVVWAAEEAQRTGRALRLVRACDADSDEDATAHDLAGLARRLTLADLEHRVTAGHPAVVLVEAARDAALLVVGRRLRRFRRGLLGGGTSLDVATHATVPVVVVPETWIQPSLCAAPIVLGLEPNDITSLRPSGEPDRLHDVIAFAFGRAADMKVSLHVVSAWTVPGAYVRNPKAIAACRERFDADLADRLRPWRDAWPEVVVQASSVAAAARSALLEASRKTQLTVVGRGAGRHLSGGTTRALVRRSRRPVAVVSVPSSLDEPHLSDGWAT